MLYGPVVRAVAQFRALLNLPTQIAAQLTAMETRMTSREQTAYDNLTARIDTVKTGWASLKSENERLTTERDQYKTALEAADANQAQAVADALAADSEHDAAAIEAADASLAELTEHAPEQPTEPEQPADPGSGEQPATEPTEVPATDGDTTTGA